MPMRARPLPEDRPDDDGFTDPDDDERWERPAPVDARTSPPTRWLWQPRPLPKPILPADFGRLTGFQRGVEAILFAAARVEHWLSPGGGLRAWLRLNLLIGFTLGASAALVLPAAGHVFAELATWAGLADTVAGHVSGAVLHLPPALVVIGSVALGIGLWRHLRGRRLARRDPRERDPRYGYDDYR